MKLTKTRLPITLEWDRQPQAAWVKIEVSIRLIDAQGQVSLPSSIAEAIKPLQGTVCLK